jgi:ABC-type transporter Mla subunit MlaD
MKRASRSVWRAVQNLGLTPREQNKNIKSDRSIGNSIMSSEPLLSEDDASELDAAIDQAIAACDGDLRATIGALIVANNFLETEVGELMKAVSHAYVRGRFGTYAG